MPLSDTTPAAPAAAEPTSTRSIIESQIENLPDREPDEFADDSAPADSSSVAMPSTTTDTAAPPSQPATAEIDELAKEFGLQPGGKNNRIPYARVKSMIERKLKAASHQHATELKTHAERLSTFEAQIAAFDQMVANPDVLLAKLAQVHPAYRRYLGQQAQQPEGVPTKIETVEDLQRVIDHQVAQRLAPIEQERHARAVVEQALPRVKAQIAEAETWPLFKENRDEILVALKNNPSWLLDAAYRHVVMPKLGANRDQLRQEILKETQSRPHSTVAGSAVTGRSGEATPSRTTNDIIRDSIRALKQ